MLLEIWVKYRSTNFQESTLSSFVVAIKGRNTEILIGDSILRGQKHET